METTMEKKYELRQLQASDVFIMARILHSIGIDEFKYVFNADFVNAAVQNSEGEAEITVAVGLDIFFEIAGIVMGNMEKCEKDVYSFLGSLSGMESKDIESLPMDTFVEMIIDVVQKDEFKDFMKVVSKLFK